MFGFKRLAVLVFCTALSCAAWAASDPSDAFYAALLSPDAWTVHTQATTVSQWHPAFHSPYSGPNSLVSTSEARTSFTSTEFLGRKLWDGGSAYFNPEVIAGQGVSHTLGLAGYPNGEIYRVDDPAFKLVLSRLYFQQIWGFSDETEHFETGLNQIAGDVSKERLTFVAGKFSLTDFFAPNEYTGDPRTQFLNWALFANGAWDYAADTRGYTYGIYSEWNEPTWAVRAASVMVPRQANGLSMDPAISKARADNFEAEYRYHLGNHPGKIGILGYMNHAHMGNYQEAIDQSPQNPDVTQTRDYSLKYGVGWNVEQELTADLGLFSRAGWNNGKTETWVFTEIDQTFSSGLSLAGTRWARPDDRVGLAFVVNGLSPEHRNYLSRGGVGFIIGDGALDYAPEQIVETYYAFHFWRYLTLTTDVQGVKNPAFNADRGPVIILAERFHIQF